MSKEKYYHSNFTGTFDIAGISILPAPKTTKVTDPKIILQLDNHPLRGHQFGFSEIEKPQPIRDLNADGTPKPKKFTQKKQPESAPQKQAEKPTDGIAIEDVTNVQLARKYLIDNHAEQVDSRTLTRKDAIQQAAASLDPPIEFPNWN